MDRLHTCYAPVRRSPPKYCYLALPLDLHVLGLSLAFILSQDQTLRCKSFYRSSERLIYWVYLTGNFRVRLQDCKGCRYTASGNLSLRSLWKSADFQRLYPEWDFHLSSCTTSIVSMFQRSSFFVSLSFPQGAKKNRAPELTGGLYFKHLFRRKIEEITLSLSKAGAKVQHFFDMTKYYCKKNAKNPHFGHFCNVEIAK